MRHESNDNNDTQPTLKNIHRTRNRPRQNRQEYSGSPIDTIMANGSGPIGAFPPPPGRVPDFDHPTDLSRTRLFAAIVVMAAAITIAFIFRVYSKTRINVGYHSEDWTCVVAYVMLMCYLGTVLVMAYFGEGYHAWEVTKDAYKNIMLALYIGSIIYCPAACFTKVSLLLFEARVFSVYHRAAQAIRVFIVALVILYLPILFAKAFFCTPIAAAWDLDIKPIKCLNQRKVFLSDMSLGLLTDIVILVLPLLLTRSLQMPLRTKIKSVGLLSAGGAATAVSMLRLYKAVEYLETTDATEGFFLLNLTTALELAIGLFCACLPSINLLFQSRFAFRRQSTANIPRTRRNGSARKPWYSMRWSKKTTTLEDSNSQGNSEIIDLAIVSNPEVVYQSDLGPRCGHITRVSEGGRQYEDWFEPPGSVQVPEEALTRDCAGHGKISRESQWDRSMP
ncbi:hypothetical protein LY76DRAFT_669760 [Colletotrichum caudatum]|nr:hypothetical protein LY76DRAFT_669760 [Colletotrichum caudatum]